MTKSAEEIFIQKVQKIRQLSEILIGLCDDHFEEDSDSVNWDHVITLGLVEEKLQEIMDRLGVRVEA